MSTPGLTWHTGRVPAQRSYRLEQVGLDYAASGVTDKRKCEGWACVKSHARFTFGEGVQSRASPELHCVRSNLEVKSLETLVRAGIDRCSPKPYQHPICRIQEDPAMFYRELCLILPKDGNVV